MYSNVLDRRLHGVNRTRMMDGLFGVNYAFQHPCYFIRGGVGGHFSVYLATALKPGVSLGCCEHDSL